MSNYPLGARNDPNAPYNEEEVKISFAFNISSIGEILSDKRLSEEEVEEKIYEYLRQQYGSDINIEDLEII